VVSFGYREPPLLTVLHVAVLAGLAVLGWVLTRRRFALRMGQ
jgi:lipooligosaccharide transport system permease protein